MTFLSLTKIEVIDYVATFHCITMPEILHFSNILYSPPNLHQTKYTLVYIFAPSLVIVVELLPNTCKVKILSTYFVSPAIVDGLPIVTPQG